MRGEGGSLIPGQRGRSRPCRSPLSPLPLAAASSLGSASWWTGASCSSERPRMMPANTPASPATGCGSHRLPRPSSQCCVRAPRSPASPGHAVPGSAQEGGAPSVGPGTPCRPHAGPDALFVLADPAQVTAMRPETHLPKGMQGVIRCPTRANPPLLSVSWTRDGRPLELDKVRPLAPPPCLPTPPPPLKPLVLTPRPPLPAPWLVHETGRLHRHCDGERRRAGSVRVHPVQQLRHRWRVPAHPCPAEGEPGRWARCPSPPSPALPSSPGCPACPSPGPAAGLRPVPPPDEPCSVSAFQDPPAFTVRPKEEYFQEVGRELVIPCAAHGDPPPTITWTKVGAGAPGNGLSPLGRWTLLLAPGASLQDSPRVCVPADATGSHLSSFLREKGLGALCLRCPLRNQGKILPLSS